MLYDNGSTDPTIIECRKCGADAWTQGRYGQAGSVLVRYRCETCFRSVVYTTGKVPVITITRIPRTPGVRHVV